MNVLALLLSGSFSSNSISTVAIGTGTVAPTKTDSSLGLAVASVVPSFTLITSGVTVTAVFPAGTFSSTQAITELGCFTTGSMYNRITFNPVNVSTTMKATFKLDLTFD